MEQPLSHKEAEKRLINALSGAELNSETNAIDKEWYSSRVRIRQALSEATPVELKRVKQVCEMLLEDALSEERQIQKRLLNRKKLKDYYRNHGKEVGAKTFEEFIDMLAI